MKKNSQNSEQIECVEDKILS